MFDKLPSFRLLRSSALRYYEVDGQFLEGAEYHSLKDGI